MPDPTPRFRLGTRGSPLALWQAREVRARLSQAFGLDPDAVLIDVIKTSGDMIQDRPLSTAGGKGLFTKEIDQALLDARIDLAVHSAKDLPTALPDGLAIAGYLPREDVRDALIGGSAPTLDGLPRGAVIGTASLRRAALVRRRRSDLRTALLRGNVETRLAKLAAGRFDATLLALAGLKRLGLDGRATEILDADVFPPAIGQGAIAVMTRAGDPRAREAVERIADAEAGVALAAERAFLAVLDGSCRTPIAGLGRLADGRARFRGLVLREDGSEAYEAEGEGPPEDAAAIGAAAGRDILARAPGDILSR